MISAETVTAEARTWPASTGRAALAFFLEMVMAMRKRSRETKKKTVDLPPKGRRNRDPITGASGSHPVETGAGALIGGAASGLVVGALGGPVGAVIGAAAGGAIAGGLVGKGIGETIDPTTKDKLVAKKTVVRQHVRRVKKTKANARNRNRRRASDRAVHHKA
jgi:uncharacterized protein YcfJ